jgi:hypothetical protein
LANGYAKWHNKFPAVDICITLQPNNSAKLHLLSLWRMVMQNGTQQKIDFHIFIIKKTI